MSQDLDFDNDPFALPPRFDNDYPFELPSGYREEQSARRRSLSRWMSDAVERASWFTLHVAWVLSIIAFWVLLMMGAATFAMSVFGGAA